MVVTVVTWTKDQTQTEPRPRWRGLCTYMGGKDSLLPAGSLGPSGVPALLGYLDSMAGSLTCTERHTNP